MYRTLLFTVIVLAATVVQAQDNPDGNARIGQTLYTSYGCYQCHGYEGQGGNAGRRLAPDPLPFAYVLAYVRRPTGQMPPYTEKVVTDKELVDIYAFLRDIRQPPSVESISILNN